MLKHEREYTRAIGSFVDAGRFPCVAAKSAYHRNNIVENEYSFITDKESDRDILKDIDAFTASRAATDGNFHSFVASFEGPLGMNEIEFEQAMWLRLQALHDLDAQTHHWDQSVSSDPAASTFSFSLRGRAFFIIGLHPNASRLSRRYERPALVFNCRGHCRPSRFFAHAVQRGYVPSYIRRYKPASWLFWQSE